jgi:hypothetical protein
MITKDLFVLEGLVLLVLLAGLPSPVHADGAYFSDLQQHLIEPEQKAVVVWDGQTETLLVSSTVRTEETTDLARLAWVLPLTSTVQPEVAAGDLRVFATLVAFFAPEHEYGTVGAAADAVTVLERKQIDLYDIAVLKAADAHALLAWLHTNGFAVPATAVPVLQASIQGEHGYFVANRIDPRSRPDLTPEALATLLRRGLATPLRITFRPPAPVYPLRISSLHAGSSTIEVYVCAPFPVEDASGLLRVDVVEALPLRVKKQLARFLDLPTASYVTRLSYHGRLSELTTDAVFRPAAGGASPAAPTPAEDLAFLHLFQDAQVDDQSPLYGGDYVYDEALVGRLLAYAMQHPTSPFADDAVFLLASHAPTSARVSPEALEALLARVAPHEVHLEALTLAEMPPLEKSQSLYYARRGSLKAFILLRLAPYYRFVLGNWEAAERLALALLPTLPRLREDDAELVQLLLPEHQRFEERFDAALAAIDQKDWPTAARVLEQVATLEHGAISCHLAPHCAKTLPAAWYLLGTVRLALQQWGAARAAFEAMLQLAPDYHDDLLFLDGSQTVLSVSADQARSYRVATYLQEGASARGLDEGLQLLRQLDGEKAHVRRGSPEVVGTAHYNVACAYAQGHDTAHALAHLKEAFFEHPQLETAAAQDTDFAALWDTAAFQELPAQVAQEQQAVAALAQATTIAPLLGALQAPAPQVRRASVHALARRTDPRAVEALLQALQDEDTRVREAAAYALAQTAAPRAVEALLQALQDEDTRVREAAAHALGGATEAQTVYPWSDPRAQRGPTDDRIVPALLVALHDPSPGVRSSAAWGLGRRQAPRQWSPSCRRCGTRTGRCRSRPCARSDSRETRGCVSPSQRCWGTLTPTSGPRPPRP